RSGTDKPYGEILPTVGTLGTTDIVARAGGTAGSFQYFVGARHGETDLRQESPNPTRQTLGNHGKDTNVVAHLRRETPDDFLGLTLVSQTSNLPNPLTPSSAAAGVSQNVDENNYLGVLSWKHNVNAR